MKCIGRAGWVLCIAIAALHGACTDHRPSVPVAAKDTVAVIPVVADEPAKSDTVILDSAHTCEGVVEEILITSPRFKEMTNGLAERIIKNGGQSYGTMLEGSPYPENDKAVDYSKTYDYSLHESYPDRMVNIARFSFDPHSKTLYEYDPVEDTLIPIKYDQKLLKKLQRLCK